MTIQVLARVFGDRKHGVPAHPARGSDRLVILSLANHANADFEAYPSIPTIAFETRLSTRRVHDALRRLEAEGWIERTFQPADVDPRIRADRRPNRYLLRFDAVASGIDEASTPTKERGGRTTRSGVDEHDATGWTERPPKPKEEPLLEPKTSSSAGADGRLVVIEERDETGRIEFRDVRLSWRVPDVATNDVLASAIVLCERLAGQLAERGERTEGKAHSKAWVLAMEQILRLDGRPASTVEWVLDWLHRGEDEVSGFWRSNVRSPAKLREKWSTLSEQYATRVNRSAAPRHALSDGAARLVEEEYGGPSSPAATAIPSRSVEASA